MRAYQLAMLIILFQLSTIIAGEIGLRGMLYGHNITTVIRGKSIWDMIGIANLAIGVIATLAGVFLRLNVGAIVFASVFTFSNLGFSSTLQRLTEVGFLTPGLFDALRIGMGFVFLFGFVQLASMPARGAY